MSDITEQAKTAVRNGGHLCDECYGFGTVKQWIAQDFDSDPEGHHSWSKCDKCGGTGVQSPTLNQEAPTESRWKQRVELRRILGMTPAASNLKANVDLLNALQSFIRQTLATSQQETLERVVKNIDDFIEHHLSNEDERGYGAVDALEALKSSLQETITPTKL